MSRFVVAYMLKNKAKETIDGMREKYDKKSASAIAAHLSLGGPNNIVNVQLNRTKDILCSIASDTLPIELKIEKVNTFLPKTNTCFLEVEPNEVLLSLHKLIMRELNWYDEFSFCPHVTITEYLSSEETEKVCKKLSIEKIRLLDTLDNISLLRKNESEKWDCIFSFKLK